MIVCRNWGHKLWILPVFVMPSKLATWTNSPTTILEKRKTNPETSRKIPGSILRSLPVVLTVQPSKTRVFADQKLSYHILNMFPIIVGFYAEFKFSSDRKTSGNRVNSLFCLSKKNTKTSAAAAVISIFSSKLSSVQAARDTSVARTTE